MAEPAESPETAASLEERVWRAHTSLDPAVLWPRVTRDLLDGALRDIVRVTRSALSGSPHAPTLAAVSPAQIHALGVAAFISGTGPLLAYWVEHGVVQAEREIATLLRRHREHAIRRHHFLTDRLAGVLQAMANRGVAPILLKGMHTAWEYFPDPATRTIADIDLLVSPGELGGASDALGATGLTEILRTARPFRSVWAPSPNMAVHSLELDHAENPWSVDLHIVLERRYARGVVASLGAGGIPPTQGFSLNGRAARGLAQPWLVAFLALHASHNLHALQLGRLVELVQVVRHDRAAGRFPEDEVLEFVRTTGIARFAYPALELSEHLAPGTFGASLLGLARAAASVRGRRVVGRMIQHGGYRLPYRSLDERLMWANGARETLLILSELFWPSESSLGDALRTLRHRAMGLSRGWFHWRG